MKKTNKAYRSAPARRRAALAALACGALIAGCATDGSMFGNGTSITASDKTRMTQSGFLSDYTRLQTTPWSDGIECWRTPNLDAKNYDKIMISRIVVSLAPAKDGDKEQTIDPSDLKTLTDYFHASLDKALKPQLPVGDSVAGTLIPYAFIAEAGSGVASGRPAGSTPYLGETGMEMQFRDGASGAVLAECRDTEIGRKYAADSNSGAGGAAQTWAGGYLNSFQSWSYAKNAFDKWSQLVAQRITLLRGTAPATSK